MILVVVVVVVVLIQAIVVNTGSAKIHQSIVGATGYALTTRNLTTIRSKDIKIQQLSATNLAAALVSVTHRNEFLPMGRSGLI